MRNEVTVEGIIARKPYMGESSYGPYAFINIANKSDNRTVYLDISCSGAVCQSVASLNEGDTITVMGRLHKKKNKNHDNVWDTTINAQSIETNTSLSTAPAQAILDDEVPF